MIEHHTSLISTNATLLERARDGAPESLWVRADSQTGGRGRQGRVWHSPPGNLYASTLVSLRPADPPAPTLALVAAIAVYEAIVQRLPNPEALRIKWPNDLLVDGAKLAGILLERAGDAVVIGIGINLAFAPEVPERATTALSDYAPVPDCAPFCETLAEYFADELGRWRNFGLADTRNRWTNRALPHGTPLSHLQANGDRIEGLFERLDGDGNLVLRLSSGQSVTITAGDVDPLRDV